MEKVTLKDIQNAREVIKDIILETDILENVRLSEKTGARIFYKCENLQRTGSFKVRGACNKIASLTEEEKSHGVIASSAGNHAQGVALGAKQAGIKATICMPANAPLSKVAATKSYGANVVLNGNVYDDALAKAKEIQAETGATFLDPFNDKYVIAGQGTIGLEIFEQRSGEVDTVIVPIGGGGIIAGIATALKGLNPDIKIIGVQTANIPSMKVSFEAGKVTSAFNDITIADGIAVKTPGDLTFDIISKNVDQVITVTEEEIAEAILFMMENQKLVSEGAGAVSTAALLSGKYVPNKGENVVCVVSGGNIDINTLYRIMSVALKKQGRRISFIAEIPDVPGSLSKLVSIIANNGANILNISQEKLAEGKFVKKQIVEATIETIDFDQINRIKSDFIENGIKVEFI
ncbi:threonine ammonia-lyase [Peptostreptococcus porci]|uniref:threonine ammonia-lyase n=1 Tax=Peptostreptococcus porci TaxID=2652282 RepID=A0A6N7XHT2_9FIRM|nr:threonine ammonia-lyase [Peptostreptococcus porci]MDY4128041.1 threonine ammonia-lyase [Peptostreptococcus porci]MDY5436471.1 threonine ammonia-lyase [Peptostreptococcus porci]MST63173.1 threonine ammonia-lyase [Peptostreptococcus porci]